MPDIYLAINPRGTTPDYKTGSPTITTSSGGFTLSVAQTGNIGQGYVIIANSIEYYISLMSNSTTGTVTTAAGATPGDVTGVSVTSIKPVWATQLDAENGVNALIGSSDLVTDEIVLHIMAYYDDDDFTADTSIDNWNSLTTNATYRVIMEAPDGGTKSINNQRTTGGFDTNKQHFTTTAGTQIADFNGNMEFIGLQFRNTNTVDPSASNIRYVGNGGGLVDSCILETPQEGNGVLINSTAGTFNIINTAVYHDGTQGSASEGIYNTAATTTTNLWYVLIRNQNDGLENDGGTVTATNCSVLDCGNDFDGTITIVNCASNDSDGSNAVTLDNGTYAYTSIWTDPNGTPEVYTLLNDTTDTNAPQNKGVDVPAITVDMLGVSRNDPPDIGPYEFASGGGTLYQRTISDTIGITDSVSRIAAMSRTIEDTLGLTDSVTRSVGFFRLISDTIGLTDSVTRVANMKRTISDTIGLTDSVSRVGTFFRTISDTLGITDSVSTVGGTPVIVSIRNFLIRIFGSPTTNITIGGELTTDITIKGSPITDIEIKGVTIL